jgi:Flp pilus assembly protein TadG
MKLHRVTVGRSSRHCNRGGAAVEFALVSLVFFTILFGAMEMGRLMFYWNTAAEVTRLGARMAVVCDPNATSRDAIRARMRQLLPIVADADIVVAYSPAGCTVDTCQLATVSIATTTPIQTYIPFVPLSVLMPTFATTLSRESMQSTFGGTANPACQ